MRAVIRRSPLWLLGLGALPLTSCGAASTSGVTYATDWVSCCQNADMNQLYHPGETLVLHWIVSPGQPTSSDAATTLTLSASLAGAYGRVTDLNAPGSSSGAASVVQVTS